MSSDSPEKPKPAKYLESIWFIYVVSVISAWNAEIVTYPLDLIKTRMQIQGELANKLPDGKISKGPYRGMLKTALGVVKEEGITQLWHGISAVFLRHSLYAGTRIVIYRKLKENVFKPNPEDNYFPLWKSAVCGVSAGAFAQYISSPAELVKVQLQMEGRRRLMGLPPRVHGIFDALRNIWASGGIYALWKGSVPNVQRAALVALGDISTYDVAKAFIMRHTSLPADSGLLHAASSGAAGFVAAVIATPADVIKTRVMNQPMDEKGRGLLYTSTLDCFRKSVQLEGFGALYKGFLPLWIRLAPWALTFWISYEQILILMGAKSW